MGKHSTSDNRCWSVLLWLKHLVNKCFLIVLGWGHPPPFFPWLNQDWNPGQPRLRLLCCVDLCLMCVICSCMCTWTMGGWDYGDSFRSVLGHQKARSYLPVVRKLNWGICVFTMERGEKPMYGTGHFSFHIIQNLGANLINLIGETKMPWNQCGNRDLYSQEPLWSCLDSLRFNSASPGRHILGTIAKNGGPTVWYCGKQLCILRLGVAKSEK